jgi:hypothetical protein
MKKQRPGMFKEILYSGPQYWEVADKRQIPDLLLLESASRVHIPKNTPS